MPHPPPPPKPPPDDDPLDADLDDDLLDAELDADDPLLDPSAWPDDEEDEETRRLLAEDPAAGELEQDAELDLTAPDDDDDDEALGGPLDDDLLDTQHDEEDLSVDLRIETRTEEALPILPMRLEVEVDGRRMQAVVNPSVAHTVLTEPGASGGSEDVRRSVRIWIRGTEVRVELFVQPGEHEGIVLGLDVLHSRFLLRP